MDLQERIERILAGLKLPKGMGRRAAERAVERGGKVTLLAGTGDAIDHVPVGGTVRATGVRLPDVTEEELLAPAPAARAPRRRAAAPASPDAMTGEDMAEVLQRDLAYLGSAVRVRFVAPSLWIDYVTPTLKLKLVVRSQHAMGALVDDKPEAITNQVSGPQGLFRTKSGTPREVLEYIVRFFKRLVEKRA
jgi:hypothetical protein